MSKQIVDFIVPYVANTYGSCHEGENETAKLVKAAMYHDNEAFKEDFAAQFGDPEADRLQAEKEQDDALWNALGVALTEELEDDIFAAVDAINNNLDSNAAIVNNPVSKKDVSRAKSIGGVCLTTLSKRRQGKAAVNKARSGREADRRLEFLYRADREQSLEDNEHQCFLEWYDEYGWTLSNLLMDGDPSVGLGPCFIGAEDYLDLWDVLRGAN